MADIATTVVISADTADLRGYNTLLGGPGPHEGRRARAALLAGARTATIHHPTRQQRRALERAAQKSTSPA